MGAMATIVVPWFADRYLDGTLSRRRAPMSTGLVGRNSIASA